MIDVAFTRWELRPADVAIVIDVLRATSTATQALAAGYRRVICADSVERAATMRGPHRVLAGERECVKPDGFDQGNSPREATELRGEELVLATTHGAPTIVIAARRAPEVLLGCLLNLDAVVARALARVDASDAEIEIACSGTGGELSVEDVYVAGRISAALPGPKTERARIAERVALAFPTPLEALRGGAGARALRAGGMADDIAYCSMTSALDCVPVVVATSPGIAVVADSANVEPAERAPYPLSMRVRNRAARSPRRVTA